METCENCGRPLSETERSFGVKRCSECTEILPATAIPPAQMAVDPVGVPLATNAPADSWTRFIAYFIDNIITSAVGAAIFFGVAFLAAGIARASGPVGDGGITAIVAVAVIAYVAFTVSYYWVGNSFGQTLGKRLLGLGVMGAHDGRRIGLRRGLVRLIVWFLGALPLYLGWLWSIWGENKQAWHDKAARSLVVQDPGFVGDAPRASVPLLAGGVVAALVAIGAMTGAVAGLLSDAATDEELVKSVTDAFDQRDARQAQIDIDSAPCSPPWTLATSQNNVEAIASAFSLDDRDGAVDEANGHLQELCATFSIDRYCRSFAETLGSRIEERITGLQSDIEVGCLQGLRSQFAAMEFEVGDCLVFDIDLGDRAVDCAEPHDAEVIHITSMPAEPAYPGEDEVLDFADEACPVTADSYYYPFALNWGVGDRRIVCLDE